jgi:hypothetical protein
LPNLQVSITIDCGTNHHTSHLTPNT